MRPNEPDERSVAPRFLIDQNVQEAVHQYLLGLGYESFWVRDLSGPGTPDDVIAYIANAEGFVVITHDGHFRDISRILPSDKRSAFRRGAGAILLQCTGESCCSLPHYGMAKHPFSLLRCKSATH